MLVAPSLVVIFESGRCRGECFGTALVGKLVGEIAMGWDFWRDGVSVGLVSVALHLGHGPFVPLNRREDDAPTNEPVQANDIGVNMILSALTSDSETWAQRDVGGGTLYMRRPSANEPWEINFWEREVNVTTAVMDGELRSERLATNLGGQTFSSPDEAAQAIRRVLQR